MSIYYDSARALLLLETFLQTIVARLQLNYFVLSSRFWIVIMQRRKGKGMEWNLQSDIYYCLLVVWDCWKLEWLRKVLMKVEVFFKK
jgi:hypothetical protein